MNHIYKFISDYEFYFGPIDTGMKKKSLSSQEVSIPSPKPQGNSHRNKDLGFQVYLAVDEFSWSKRTEPHSFRRNIINMSVANEKYKPISKEYTN